MRDTSISESGQGDSTTAVLTVEQCRSLVSPARPTMFPPQPRGHRFAVTNMQPRLLKPDPSRLFFSGRPRALSSAKCIFSLTSRCYETRILSFTTYALAG